MRFKSIQTVQNAQNPARTSGFFYKRRNPWSSISAFARPIRVSCAAFCTKSSPNRPIRLVWHRQGTRCFRTETFHQAVHGGKRHQSRRRHGSQGRRIRRGDNEDILELARAYPQTFIPFAGLNPYDADLPDRVDALARQGFRGVCLDGGWRRSFASHRKTGG